MILVGTATLVGLAMLALPGVMHSVGRRLPPGPWAILCALALAGGALLVVSSAFLVASPLVFTSLGFSSLARACEQMLGQLSPGGPLAAAAAVGAASAICICGSKAIWHAHRLRKKVYLGA